MDWFAPDRQPDRRARWVIADLALTALFAVITYESLRSDAYVDMYGSIEGAGWLLALSPTLLLPFRRVAPATTLALATVLYLWVSAVQGDSNAPLAAPLFAYSVGMSRPIRSSGTIVAVAALAMSTSTLYGPGDPDALLTLAWFLLFGSGWLIAVAIRRSQTRAEQLRREVDDLEAHHDEVARQAVADERLRIAQELHDAVGHTVNVIVLQAGAARLAGDRDRAIEALTHIEQLGRNALTDLDHLLGLLHETQEPTLAPQRTVADLVGLVEQLRSSGVDVELHRRCGADLDWRTVSAIYRIAQEALTNAVKHADADHIVVTLDCDGHAVRLVVTDDGRGRDARRSSGGGRGIPGMAERAAVLGGRLTAGPAPTRGYVVEAVLPLSPDPERARRTAVAS